MTGTVTASAATDEPYDLLSVRADEDPHPLLHRMRAEHPVYWSPQLSAWLVTRYDDIAAALGDLRLGSIGTLRRIDTLPEEQRLQLAPLRATLALWMGKSSPGGHLRVQRVLKRYFTPRTVEALRPRVRAIAEELVDEFTARGEFEAVGELAYPLPARVIAELLGVPPADRDLLPRWSRDITSVFFPLDIDRLLASQRSIMEMLDYLRDILAERRREPRDDAISAMAAAQEQGTMVSEEEVLANCALLLFAGHETTALLICKGLLLLLQHPEQLAALRADPGGLPGAIEEMLRVASPGLYTVRIPAEPVEVGGTTIPAHQIVFLMIGAGNRDPQHWPDPDRFDVTREVQPHLGFGHGTFYCLGAALARLEAQVCFETLFRRTGNLALHPDGPTWSAGQPMNGLLTRLPITMT